MNMEGFRDEMLLSFPGPSACKSALGEGQQYSFSIGRSVSLRGIEYRCMHLGDREPGFPPKTLRDSLFLLCQAGG